MLRGNTCPKEAWEKEPIFSRGAGQQRNVWTNALQAGGLQAAFCKKGLIAGRWGEWKKECFTGVTELQNDGETIINK